MKGQPRREGPVRARALAQKGGAAQGPESATAWLDGCHEAIALHPEWQQVGNIRSLSPSIDGIRIVRYYCDDGRVDVSYTSRVAYTGTYLPYADMLVCSTW